VVYQDFNGLLAGLLFTMKIEVLLRVFSLEYYTEMIAAYDLNA